MTLNLYSKEEFIRKDSRLPTKKGDFKVITKRPTRTLSSVTIKIQENVVQIKISVYRVSGLLLHLSMVKEMIFSNSDIHMVLRLIYQKKLDAKEFL